MPLRRIRLLFAFLALSIFVPIAMGQNYSRNPKLVGHWNWKGAEGAATLVISADGTWSAITRSIGQDELRFEGKWITDKDYVYWAYTKSSTPKVKVGARDKDRLLEIGQDHFELQTSDNRLRTYFRVK